MGGLWRAIRCDKRRINANYFIDAVAATSDDVIVRPGGGDMMKDIKRRIV